MELEKEFEYYKKVKPELIKEQMGKFVVIKDEKILDFFDSYEDAFKAGIKAYGNIPFFIQQITAEETCHFFTGIALCHA